MCRPPAWMKSWLYLFEFLIGKKLVWQEVASYNHLIWKADFADGKERYQRSKKARDQCKQPEHKREPDGRKCNVTHHPEEKHSWQKCDQAGAQGVLGFEDWEFRFHKMGVILHQKAGSGIDLSVRTLLGRHGKNDYIKYNFYAQILLIIMTLPNHSKDDP